MNGYQPGGDVEIMRASGSEGIVAGQTVQAGHWLALVGGRSVGVASCSPCFFGHAFIDALAVEENWRRQGVARELLRACAATALTDRVFTSTNASNSAAQALFLKNGFRPSGYIDNLDDGDPELVYCKRLAASLTVVP